MLKYLLPLLGFGLLALLLAIGLRLNPREIPSPLLGKPVPTFSLPILQQTEQRFGPEQMQGQVWLLNVWASWCVSCREEHGTLLQWVASSPIKLIGLNYKDQAEQAAQWLNSLGNPYQLSAMDSEGRVGIELGVYGVPETFVIDKHGVIRHKHTGPIGADDIQQRLLPLIQQLEAEN